MPCENTEPALKVVRELKIATKKCLTINMGSVVSRVTSGLAPVRVPEREVKADGKPANLLHHLVTVTMKKD